MRPRFRNIWRSFIRARTQRPHWQGWPSSPTVCLPATSAFTPLDSTLASSSGGRWCNFRPTARRRSFKFTTTRTCFRCADLYNSTRRGALNHICTDYHSDSFLKILLVNYAISVFWIPVQHNLPAVSLSFRKPLMPQTPTMPPKEMIGCTHRYYTAHFRVIAVSNCGEQGESIYGHIG